MPGRTFISATGYRYGFNGKENDNEVKGNENSVDFGDRVYDPRIGRWLSTDPFKHKYPNISPFAFSLNCPIKYKDAEGGWVVDENGNYVFTPTGSPKMVFHGSSTADPVTGVRTGPAYEVQGGYVYTNAGKKVYIEIATTGKVYANSSQEPSRAMNVPAEIDDMTGKKIGRDKVEIVPGKFTLGVLDPENDATANCHGTSFLKGKANLYVEELTPQVLAEEGWEKIGNVGDPNVQMEIGDVGVYQTATYDHSETGTGNNCVTSKGGINLKKENKDVGKNWSFKFDVEGIFRRNATDRKVDSKGKGTEKNGFRFVTEKQAKQIDAKK